ncbi:MAG: putative S-layer protein [Nanoarchaeota archaeon]|nr:putative S-layer protein [Nanoarchaeota archaeon]
MKKLSIASIFLMLMLVLFVFSQTDDLSMTVTNPEDGLPGASVSGVFNLGNTGIEDIEDIDFTITEDLNGPGAYTLPLSAVTFSPTSVDLLAGEDVDVTYTIAIPSQQYVGEYDGVINASNGTYTVEGSFSFDVLLDVAMSVSGLDTNGDFVISSPENIESTKTLTISNDGNVDLTNVKITIDAESNAFTSGSKSITFKIDSTSVSLNSAYNIGTVVPGTQNVVISASIPNNMDVDTYEGNITVQATNYPEATVTFPLMVRVEPEICSDGRVKDGNSVNFNAGNLRISIDEPNNGDDFEQGDEFDIQVTIDNEDNNDMDIIVEAILYDVNEDNEIESVESDQKEVKDGDEEDFDLTLTVPYDDKLDEDNEYVLYIKAYEDGDEDQNCEYDNIDLDFKRNTNEVIIDDFTITPTLVSCGDLVNFNVDVLNVGEKDEDDVYIKIINTELGLSEESNKFDLGKYDDSDNDATKSFSFSIPSDAIEKDYLVEARVYFDDGDDSYSTYGTLTVSNCGAVTISEIEGTSVNLPQSSFTTQKGAMFTVPVMITNSESASKTYVIEFAPTGSWTGSLTETLTVSSGQSGTGYLYITPTASATGSQTGTVTVKQNGNVIDTESISVNIQSGSTPTTGAGTYQPTGKFWEDITSNTAFWIVGNVILVILIVLVLFFIFRKR